MVRTRMYEIKLHPYQHKMFFDWVIECVYLYNFCVDRYKLEKFSLNYTKSKLLIFSEFYGSNIRESYRQKYIDLYINYYNELTNILDVYTD